MTSFMQMTGRRRRTRKVTMTGRVMLTLKGLKVMMTLIMLITRREKNNWKGDDDWLDDVIYANKLRLVFPCHCRQC